MKKLAWLVLALIMCLTLCACSKADNTYEKYDELIEYLESGNYDRAIGYIENMRVSSDTLEQDGADTDADESSSNELLSHPLSSYMLGEWLYTPRTSDDQLAPPCSAIVFNEDGTCTVDGNDASWKLSSETHDDFLRIDIYENGTPTLSAGYHANQDNLGVWPFDYYGGVDYSWTNTTRYNIVELTVDNWKDYFELVTVEEYSENAFGELDRLHLYQQLELKGEKTQSITQPEFVVEISSAAAYYNITLDPVSRSYTIGDRGKDVDLEADIYTCRNTIPVFGNNYINADDNADTESPFSKTVILVQSVDDITVHRIQGSIIVAK